MQSTKKIIMLIATGLVILGFSITLITLVAVRFDWHAISTTVPSTEQKYTQNAEGISTIHISSSVDDISVVPSDGQDIEITYFDTEYNGYTIDVNANTLKVTFRTENKPWFENLAFYVIQDTPLIIHLPKEYSGALRLETMSGNIALSHFNALDSLEANSLSGDVELRELLVKNNLKVSNASGHCRLDQLDIGKHCDIDTVSGDIKLSQVKTGENQSIESLSGDMDLENTEVIGNVRLDSTSGDIEFDHLSGNHFVMESFSGEISGTINGNESDYVISVETLSGEVDVPRQHQSDRTKRLEVSTISGDVEIEFSGR